MARKAVKFDMAGHAYRITPMAAREGLDYMGMSEGDIGPIGMLKGLEVETADGWVFLDSEAAINANVFDISGIIPPFQVLCALHEFVKRHNFGFMHGRKSPVIPGRFRSAIVPVVCEDVHPTIAALIDSGKATMHELETIYSVEDAVRMSDVIVTAGINAALSHELAAKEAKQAAKSRR
ncbi:hypothetical protein [Burkholderia gladioli]|uniref:hypothetical protein n=1 Tax=Burkholderia gladioli TaxID=28095 RepID=UPI00163FE068|nr:hypothetical protein [Burkholderia gladioli]